MHVVLNIWNRCCHVVREAGDPVFRDSSWGSADSRLLYHVRNVLRRQGLDVIKKLMWKDGHLVDSSQHYLRTRGPRCRRPHVYIYWHGHSVQSAATGRTFNAILKHSMEASCS